MKTEGACRLEKPQAEPKDGSGQSLSPEPAQHTPQGASNQVPAAETEAPRQVDESTPHHAPRPWTARAMLDPVSTGESEPFKSLGSDRYSLWVSWARAPLV